MERYGRTYISPEYTREDFLELGLSLESFDWVWQRALDIFEDRFQRRYFDPIGILMGDVNRNGFAIMALLCLLIETLYQFRDGLTAAQPGKNRESYVNFLRLNLPDVFDRAQKAECFYGDIRCGILHSAQTKNGSQLTFGKNYTVELFEGKKIRVDVRNLADRIWDYYMEYKGRLLNPEEVYLRENFIKKMKHICRFEDE